MFQNFPFGNLFKEKSDSPFNHNLGEQATPHRPHAAPQLVGMFCCRCTGFSEAHPGVSECCGPAPLVRWSHPLLTACPPAGSEPATSACQRCQEELGTPAGAPRRTASLEHAALGPTPSLLTSDPTYLSAHSMPLEDE